MLSRSWNNHKLVDPAYPLNPDWAFSRGLVLSWDPIPNPGWRGGAYLYDMTRGGQPPFDGVISGGYTWDRQGVTFNGTTGKATFGSSGKLDLTSAITVRLKFKLNSTSTQVLAGKDKDSGGRSWAVDYLSGDLRFYVNGGGGGSLVSIAISANVIYDALFCYEGTALVIHLNGREAAAGAYGGGLPSATANVTLGAREYSGFENFSDATFYSLQIWNRSLSRVNGTAAGDADHRTLQLYKEVSEEFSPQFNWVKMPPMFEPVAGGGGGGFQPAWAATQRSSILGNGLR